jgi:hypothetical protein
VVLDSDPNHFVTQAALFRAGRVELIPPRPNELQGQVLRITDSGIALVQSTDSTSLVSSYYLYRPGREISLGFGGSQVGRPHVNDLGVTAGTTLTSPARAFRFQPPANMTLLAPVSPDPESWGLAIASNGDVLGYSFDYAGEERIGVWRKAVFQTWFIEATAEYPTISNSLLWNRSGLIVISDTSDLNSYLVPRPGVRLNVADLTDSLPTWTRMFSINARGDMVGWGGSQRFQRESTFLLQRLPEGPGEVATWKPHAFPPPAAHPGLLASHGGLPARIEASLFGDTAMRKRK